MNNIRVTSRDIALIKQNHQRRYIKVQVINRNLQSICIIKGRLISANCSIDSGNGIRRTASLTIKTESQIISLPFANLNIDLQRDFSFNYYIRLWVGIEDNDHRDVIWYNQGLFVINQSQYNFDASTNTLTLSLTDLMSDLTGDRAGILHAYTSLVKNQQRIDDVMKNVLDIAGVRSYNITPICPLSIARSDEIFEPSDEDYLIPYDMNFSAGVSAYDILDKLVSLYPYYEIGFDVNGTFFCRKKILDGDDSWVTIDAATLRDITISEDTSMDWFSVKNYIEVWGKDGLYYGEAKDENPESPFQVAATAPFRKVITGSEDGVDPNNICDRYKDPDLQEQYEKDQATYEEIISRLSAEKNPTETQKQELNQARRNLETVKSKIRFNLSISGNELAQEWAEQKLYENSRVYDSITITTLCMPFLNDVNFKVSYRTKVDDKVYTYMVTALSHDYVACTTTLTMTRFYDNMCSNMYDTLSAPSITNYTITGSELVVYITPVNNAESYDLFLDRQKVSSGTGNTLTYTFEDWQEGSHTFVVQANAPYYASNVSDSLSIYYVAKTCIVTDNDEILITDDNNIIVADEEE